MNMSAEQRLERSGIALPPAPKPLGAYVPAVQVGNLLYLSGTLPLADSAPKFQGRIGADIGIEDGRSAARLAALNALALARQHLGSLDSVTRIVRLTVSLATTAEFRDHAKVADGASELLASVFGAEQAPTRMVSGVLSLPAGAPVVVEILLEVD
ncbi:RidA family protein [Peristeroidobacter agariperforans]|uniref:RidA family protein n=1 Tax=Peristeroidobacter agariperforans TaxID=268404 RepID=UPI00101DE0E4|nr:RidA family protein [Peristeroidobacter agariperforans]